MLPAAILVMAGFSTPALSGNTAETSTAKIDDGRRTMSRLPSNIGRGFIGVFHADSVSPFLIGAAATGLSTLLDDEVRDFIADEDDDPAQFADDNLGPTGLGIVALGLFIGGRHSDDARFRAMSYDLGVSSLVTLGYTGILKAGVDRERPNKSGGDSFPSGHTSNAFALATVADVHYGKQVGAPAYVAASIIGLSRLRRNAHWFSDVVAGGALGHLVGKAVVRQNGAPTRSGSTALRAFSIMPSLAPSFQGVYLGMQF